MSYNFKRSELDCMDEDAAITDDDDDAGRLSDSDCDDDNVVNDDPQHRRTDRMSGVEDAMFELGQ